MSFSEHTGDQRQPPKEPPIGVLIMAYGGPNSLDEIAGYLADIRSGRPTSPEVLEEIRHNYAQIGGKSPLLEISRRQAAGVAARLDPDHFRVYVGMRHWSPWIEEVVGEMAAEGIRRAISVVLAPHFSKLSVERYQAKIADGLAMYHGDIQFDHIASYHTAPLLIEAFAERVALGLAEWPADEQESVHIVFSAHSLPSRILQMGDPYQDQLLETARLIAKRAGLASNRWSWSYQSAGRSPEPWLGPQIQEHIRTLAGEGIKNVVSIPIGFVSDHVEILYDIDLQAQAIAAEIGMRLVRPPSLNDDPLYLQTLADLIKAHAAKWF